MRILIVEDDARIARSVAEHLRRQHNVVEVAYDGRSGLQLATTSHYDLLLIDINIPEPNGLTICTTLRAQHSTAPVVMLTARDAIDDKVRALDAGADDYLTKPFDLAELSARIRAVARRGAPGRPPVLRFGPLEIDRAAMRVCVGERRVSCTPTEFTILETLLRSPRQVFSREMLIERVAPLGGDAANDSIKTHIANLRRKVRAAGYGGPVIETLYGSGYRLADL
ncbi:MAG TPA: response regulator transcription factor [Candidatus Nitrosotalea sp.]|nr:response regulator transcription factor [Candidatus Nitrosotalea sp.]